MGHPSKTHLLTCHKIHLFRHLLQHYQDCHSWLRAHSSPTMILLHPAHSKPASHRAGTVARLVRLPEPGRSSPEPLSNFRALSPCSEHLRHAAETVPSPSSSLLSHSTILEPPQWGLPHLQHLLAGSAIQSGHVMYIQLWQGWYELLLARETRKWKEKRMWTLSLGTN